MAGADDRINGLMASSERMLRWISKQQDEINALTARVESLIRREAAPLDLRDSARGLSDLPLAVGLD